MATPWVDVADSPAYQALPPDQQAAAREQYFSTVVAPQISDPDQVIQARAQFDQQTGGNYTPLEQHLMASGTKTPAQIDALHKANQLQTQAQNFNPNSDMSFGQQVMANAGQTVYNTARGIGQITGLIPQDQIDAAKQQDAPLLNTSGAATGQVLGYGAQTLLPGGALKTAGLGAKALGAADLASALTDAGGSLLAPNTIKGGAALGATQAALQPVATGDSRITNALAGGAAGLLGTAAPRAIGALTAPVSDAVRGLAQRAEDMGITLTPAQLSDSTFVKTLKSVVDKFPLSGADVARRAQGQQYNQALANTFGEQLGPNGLLTADVAANAKARLGNMYDQAAANGVPVDAQTLQNLTSIRDQAQQVLGSPSQSDPISTQVQNIINKIGDDNTIDGRTYKTLVGKGTPLDVLANSNDSSKALYAQQVKSALKDAIRRNGTPEQQQMLAVADPQYRALMTLQPLIAKSSSGYISPTALMSKVSANTPDMAYGGGGDLADLARLGQGPLKNVVPDSGTAQRSALTNALLRFGGPAGVGAGAVAAHSLLTPATGGAALGGIAAARGIRSLLDNPTVAKAMLARNAAAQQALQQALSNLQPAERTAVMDQISH